MKIKQKDNYQIDNEGVFESMPQFINLQDFVKARAHEINHFTNVMRSKTNSKLTHQLLPKHMRRRAMAHNHYRIPVRIRLQALTDLMGSEPPGLLKRSKCRRHRRKLRYLLHLYTLRQRRFRWMETHVWHSKRFKMHNVDWTDCQPFAEPLEPPTQCHYQGSRIALKCNDKSERSVYKLCQKQSSCIMDQSYLLHFFITQSQFEAIKGYPQCSLTSLSGDQTFRLRVTAKAD
mmetsp:Transcript_5445/g.9192  ORF Transcript_5445/g.9192 Transcript_5445/m.9192 type:complete len:232 (+) Transcript_5445:167-862(+)